MQELMRLRTKRPRTSKVANPVQKLLERNQERELVAVWLMQKTNWQQNAQLMQLVCRLQGDELLQCSPLHCSLMIRVNQALLARVVQGSTASLAQ